MMRRCWICMDCTKPAEANFLCELRLHKMKFWLIDRLIEFFTIIGCGVMLLWQLCQTSNYHWEKHLCFSYGQKPNYRVVILRKYPRSQVLYKRTNFVFPCLTTPSSFKIVSKDSRARSPAKRYSPFQKTPIVIQGERCACSDTAGF